MVQDMSDESVTSATVACDPTASAYDWNQAWEVGITPWDRSGVQPALVELVDEFGSEWGLEDLKHGKALVPGCGRGYDVSFLSSKVGECYGLDISLKAIEEAQKWVASQVGSGTRNITFLHGDFFSFEIPDESFQLAYDYTFLCALPPSRRPEWSSRYSQLLKPGGRLITLIFPVGSSDRPSKRSEYRPLSPHSPPMFSLHTDGDRPGGPPFSVDPDEVYELLTKVGFERIYAKVPLRTNFPQRELMAVWRKL